MEEEYEGRQDRKMEKAVGRGKEKKGGEKRDDTNKKRPNHEEKSKGRKRKREAVLKPINSKTGQTRGGWDEKTTEAFCSRQSSINTKGNAQRFILSLYGFKPGVLL